VRGRASEASIDGGRKAQPREPVLQDANIVTVHSAAQRTVAERRVSIAGGGAK
jgi:hypothetical protein